MPDNTYTPRPGSVAEQVCIWLKDNAGKELSTSEVTEQFACRRHHVGHLAHGVTP